MHALRPPRRVEKEQEQAMVADNRPPPISPDVDIDAALSDIMEGYDVGSLEDLRQQLRQEHDDASSQSEAEEIDDAVPLDTASLDAVHAAAAKWVQLPEVAYRSRPKQQHQKERKQPQQHPTDNNNKGTCTLLYHHQLEQQQQQRKKKPRLWL